MLTADKIKLVDALKGPLGGYAQKGQSSLADALGTLSNQARTSQIATGRPMGEYTGQALGRANTMASRGIDDTLAGVLGNSSYGEAKDSRDFERNLELARRYGRMMQPSQTQEYMRMGGQLLGAGANIYGASRGWGSPGSNAGPRMASPKLNLWDSMNGSGMGGY